MSQNIIISSLQLQLFNKKELITAKYETWLAKVFRLYPVVTCQAKLLRFYLFQDVTEKRIGAMETMSTNLEKQLKETKDFRKRKPTPGIGHQWWYV